MIKLKEFSPFKLKAISGAAWTMGSYGFGQVLRFGSNLILTRLLYPELFGLMALATVFMMGIGMFSDIGIGPSIIRNPKGDDKDFLNTAWTIQAIRGFVVFICSIAIAVPVSMLYNNAQLVWIIPVLGIPAALSGFTSTNVITCNRHMNLRRLTLFDLFFQILGLVITLVWAWIHPSIWALLGGNLVSSALKTVTSHYVLPGNKNRFCWNKEVLHEIVHFGKWIFLSSVLTFFSNQLDRLILGKAFTFAMLGVFTIAYSMSDIPRQVLGVMGDKVIFPAVSKFIQLPRPQYRETLLRNRKLILILIAVGLAGLSGFGDMIIKVLYDKRYEQAVWMFPILAIGIWPFALGHTMDASLWAFGKIKAIIVALICRIIFMLVAIPAGNYFFGTPGAVIAVSLASVPFYIAVTWGAALEGIASFWQDFKTTVLFVGLTGFLIILRMFVGLGSPFAGM